MLGMKTGLAARHELVSFNRPLARGAPSSAANENLPDVDFPVPRPLFKIRIVRQAARAITPHARGLAAAVAEEIAHGRALVLAPVCLGAGAAAWFSVEHEPSLFSVAALTILLSGAVFVNRYRRQTVAAIAGLAALVLAGALLAAFETWRTDTILLDKPVTTKIAAIVEAREASGAGRYTYRLTLLDTAEPHLNRAPESISVLARGVRQPAEVGDRISGTVHLSPPSGPALPGLHDFAFSSWFSGKGANGYFLGAPKVTPAATEDMSALSWRGFLRHLNQTRAAIGDRIRTTIGGDEGAFAAALITNEQKAISPQTIEILRLSGLAHIIAISGMNMALAAGIFFIGLRSILSLSVGFVQGVNVKKLAAAGALVATTAYYLISGFAVSAERAYLMMAIMLIAVFFDRPALSLRNIGLSAILILAITPSAVLGASLQMSYAGTLGLVAGYEYWASRSPRQRRKPLFDVPQPLPTIARFMTGAFVTSLIGGALTALFSAEHFQRISTYGLAANLLAEPLISLIVMPAGFLAMLLMPLGLDWLPLLVMGYGLKGVMAVGTLVSSWGGQWQTGVLPFWFFSLASLGFLLLTLLRTRLRLAGLALSLGAFACLPFGAAPLRPNFVLSEDGKLAAFVAETGFAPNRPHPPDFLFSQWQRALDLDGITPPFYPALPEDVRRDEKRDRYRPLTDEEEIAERTLMQEMADTGKPGQFQCKKNAWCLGRQTKHGTIAILDNSIYTGTACDVADIVVASPPPQFDHCKSGALLITRETLRRTGALTFQFTGNPRAPDLEAAMIGNRRAWAEFRSYDWRTEMDKPELPNSIASLIGDRQARHPEEIATLPMENEHTGLPKLESLPAMPGDPNTLNDTGE